MLATAPQPKKQARTSFSVSRLINNTADAAVELAVNCGWLLADGKKGVCLTDDGRSLVKKELSPRAGWRLLSASCPNGPWVNLRAKDASNSPGNVFDHAIVGLAHPQTKEEAMSSTTDKLKGAANQVAGKVKQGVGEATDDPALKGEGKVQEAKGDLQKAVGKGKDAIKKAGDL
jgi:uncharacterized protein YjbJ (UPF0337 family)